MKPQHQYRLLAVIGAITPCAFLGVICLPLLFDDSRPLRDKYMTIVLWALAILTIVFVFVILRIQSLQRHIATHPDVKFCGKCGYDLRATPERCPECGMVQRKKEIAAT